MSVSGRYGPWGEAPGDDFRDVNYLEVVAPGVVGGVLKHDGTVRAGDRHRRGLSSGELSKAKLIDPLAHLLPLVVSCEKPGAAGSAALGVLAMVRRFRERDSASVKDFARRSGDPPAPSQVARVMVGCGQM